MRRTGTTRRHIGLALVMSLTTSFLAFWWSGTALAACGSNLDVSLSMVAAPGPGENITYTPTVTNYGPSCAHGVRVNASLGSPFVSFSSADAWFCSPPGGRSVECVLQTDLDEGSSSSLALEAAGPGPAYVTARGFVSAHSLTDLDPSNNQAWAALGTGLTTDPQGPNAQTTAILRPDPAPISAQEVLPSSRQGSGVPAPCEPRCIEGLESIFSTPPTDPDQFPEVHLTVVLSVEAKVASKRFPVYRFDDESRMWRGPLPPCGAGGPIDPDVGCVQTVSYENGVATAVIWTSHNGHIRG